jgi:hypothetical protein
MLPQNKNRLAAAAAIHFPDRCQPKKHGLFLFGIKKTGEKFLISEIFRNFAAEDQEL